MEAQLKQTIRRESENFNYVWAAAFLQVLADQQGYGNPDPAGCWFVTLGKGTWALFDFDETFRVGFYGENELGMEGEFMWICPFSVTEQTHAALQWMADAIRLLVLIARKED